MEDDDNLSKQADEIQALAAIYPDEWKVEDEAFQTYKASITEGGETAVLLVTLPKEYPALSPPYYLMMAPWMKENDKEELYNQLEQIYLDNIGESILHLWIEKVREFMQTKYIAEPSNLRETLPSIENPIENHSSPGYKSDVSISECPSILSSEPFTDRKSTFQGHAATVKNVAEIKLVLAKLYENRKIAQATHNIYAYRIYNDDTKMMTQDCEDDGETHAGSRLMHLLQILDVKNVIVVVSRWFGGILLGGDRFKHINNAARDVLEHGRYILPSKAPMITHEDTTKKKTKKK